MFEIAVIALTLTALLAYINQRWIGLPSTIGVMIIAMLISIGLVVLNSLGFYTLSSPALAYLQEIDFSVVLMQGMLSLLLFAGALHVDVAQLRTYKWPVFGLAIFGTLVSTALVGLGTYWLLGLLHVDVGFWYCMMFGALISPTDPIAVMAVLKHHQAPDSLGVVIAGESLFNDGVGVVLFTLLSGIALKGDSPDLVSITSLIAHEVIGGLALGVALGFVLYYMLKSIDNYSVEVLLTLSAVLGGYLMASKLHTSGPLCMVVTGLIVGNHARDKAMSDTTRHHVDLFWKLIDEILNAVLFVLLGLEIILLTLSWNLLGLSLLIIVLTLFARYISVGLPIKLTKSFTNLPSRAWQVLTWGGLRGGISVALALSLPADQSRTTILSLTYGVVIFSMLVQGLTIGGVIKQSVSNDI